MKRRSIPLLVATVVAIATPGVARAAFPGDTGDVAWGVIAAGHAHPQIHRMTYFGTNEVTLTTGTEGAKDPDWSPDGTRIVFERPGTGHGDLWLMNADGTDPVALTETDTPERTPAWSPDGSRIAFVSKRNGTWGLFVQRVGSNRAKHLVRLSSRTAVVVTRRETDRVHRRPDRQQRRAATHSGNGQGRGPSRHARERGWCRLLA